MHVIKVCIPISLMPKILSICRVLNSLLVFVNILGHFLGVVMSQIADVTSSADRSNVSLSNSEGALGVGVVSIYSVIREELSVFVELSGVFLGCPCHILLLLEFCKWIVEDAITVWLVAGISSFQILAKVRV